MSFETLHGAKARLLRSASTAFLAHGYDGLSMAMLAELCGLSRRALYHHYSSKEEVFRATLRINNAASMDAADLAAMEALEHGDGAVDVIALWLDTRFGVTRRDIGATRFGRELNDIAFRIGMDIIIEVSSESNRRIANLVEALGQRGKLRLRDGVSIHKAARLVGDGARGVNQARPPIPNDQIAHYYRDITEAVLFGCAA